ncbi:pantetheine-phosphate adenylyltransferase [Anaerobranca gottschalkii]|uniref:Phosphopantetheine adenylyltransferase n=1 Tax=Anaerobranca gottschalkii DSM 13577 TaxID=1120990 RepID=A0A1H9YYK2_9FIRM|nr:pantetheine-phosphate adenylyltransferase [Anaerobranca gottschalkii]SES74284.1 Phosphopantetheine adenylyltransferase [Anaerobranca gottschalkii DSM 13577]
MKRAVYPGSFDPITKGHLDIIKRASKIFDEVIVAVATNSSKKPLFTIEERIEIINKVVQDYPNVKVDTFNGLLVEYCSNKEAYVIIKGLRAVSDFEYEFQMASINKKLKENIETLFMMTNTKYSYLSSSLVKEIGRLNGSIEDLVPQEIIPIILKKLNSLQ